MKVLVLLVGAFSVIVKSSFEAILLDKLTNVLLSSPLSPAASRGATIGVISEVIRIPTNKNSHIKIFQNQNIFHEEWNQAGFSIDGKCEVPWDYSSYSETLNFYSPILFGVELFIVQNIQPTFLIISTLCPPVPLTHQLNLTFPPSSLKPRWPDR